MRARPTSIIEQRALQKWVAFLSGGGAILVAGINLAAHIVLAGSFTRVVFAQKGDTLHADFGPLGGLAIQFI